jgi:hypothetical protein
MAAVFFVVANCNGFASNPRSHEHARQEIANTDFPPGSIEFYACWDGEHWVIMLPGEY